MMIMTKDDFLFLIETKKDLEFKYNNKTYHLTYDKNSSGQTVIRFGELYEEKEFDCVGELLNHAKVENHFFKNMLEIL